MDKTVPEQSQSSKPVVLRNGKKGDPLNRRRTQEQLLASARLNPGSVAKKPRFSRFRIFLWVAEAIVLLAVIEQFVLKPRQQRRKMQEMAAQMERPDPQKLGEPAVILGKRARQLPGLAEVEDAVLAPLEGLAQGSSTMQATQADVSATNLLPVEVVNTSGMRFRLVPAGTCTIGSPDGEAGRGSIEVPHVVPFPSHFYMGKFEVTQGQWEAVMGKERNPSGFRGRDRPVEEVSWYDCQQFAILLCQLEKVPVGTYRLPTEAEWEYCCRAGTTTAFHCGDDPAQLARFADYAGNNYTRTVPVGQKLPNALGLFKMHGNVWEWCLDDYANYPGDESPRGEHNKYPCVRGGNWYADAPECRSANRARLPGASHGNMLGLRLLRQIVPPKKITTPLPSRDLPINPEVRYLEPGQKNPPANQ